jgi:hypothetical protein
MPSSSPSNEASGIDKEKIVTRYVVAAFLAIGLGSVAFAESEKDRKAGKSEAAAPSEKPAKPAKSAKPVEPPAENTKQTPFGPVEAKPEELPPAADLSSDAYVSAEEKGEVVIFRRKTPFGSQVWKKKKTELTADEQALLARGRGEPLKQPAAQDEAPAAKDASKPGSPNK